MASTWDKVLLFGTWLDDEDNLRNATYKVYIKSRLSNSDDETIRPPGIIDEGSLQVGDPDFPSMAVLVPATDDPEIRETGWYVYVVVTFSFGDVERYVLETPIALSGEGGGIDLGTVSMPDNFPEDDPAYKIGIPGGLAVLDDQGRVLDGSGDPVTGGGGVGGGGVGTVTSVNEQEPNEAGAVIVSYSNIPGTPELGTAAAKDSSEFDSAGAASAAQTAAEAYTDTAIEGVSSPEGAMIWKGDWDPDTDYKIGEVVKRSAPVYVAKVDVNAGELGDPPPFVVTGRHKVTSGSSFSASLTSTTNNVTPTADSTLIYFQVTENNSHLTAPVYQTPVGGGWTYQSVADAGVSTLIPFSSLTDASFRLSGVMWRADVGGSPNVHTIVGDPYAGTELGLQDACSCDFTGFETSTPVQTKTAGATVFTAPSGASITLDASPEVGDLVIVAFGCGTAGSGAAATPQAGSGKAFTQLFNESDGYVHSSLWYRVWDGTESDTITTSAVAGGQNVGNWIAIAAEFAKATASYGSEPPNSDFWVPL